MVKNILEEDKVKVICYGDVEVMTRNKAIKFYKECASMSDCSEKERYMNVLMDLYDGRSVAFDGVDAPKGYHVCKYCGNLVKGTDEDVLCNECRYDFGHALYSEL